MTTIETTTTTIEPPRDDFVIDDAQLAAVAFLARYSGRTLDAYRHDLRGFFQWAADNQLTVLVATRPHIELFRSWMEERGLAASTIDRRLSTVCGFYRFAHIDGANRLEPGAVRPPWARAASQRRSRWSHGLLARLTWWSANAVRGPSCAGGTGSGSIDAPRTGGFVRSASAPDWAPCIRTCFELRSSWPPSTLAFRSVTCSSLLAMPIRARPRSTTVAARTSIATPPTSSSPSWLEADPADQTGGGSIRSIVLTRSIERSKEAILPIPVVSAQATRYASAKSIRSVSYTSTARRSSAGSTQTIESNARSERTASPTWSRGAA